MDDVVLGSPGKISRPPNIALYPSRVKWSRKLFQGVPGYWERRRGIEGENYIIGNDGVSSSILLGGTMSPKGLQVLRADTAASWLTDFRRHHSLAISTTEELDGSAREPSIRERSSQGGVASPVPDPCRRLPDIVRPRPRWQMSALGTSGH